MIWCFFHYTNLVYLLHLEKHALNAFSDSFRVQPLQDLIITEMQNVILYKQKSLSKECHIFHIKCPDTQQKNYKEHITLTDPRLQFCYKWLNTVTTH